MIDILDVVVPAYNAGIIIDLLDYHRINGKKTVDKYVNIQQEQLEEVIFDWEDEREVKHATYFGPEKDKPARVVVVVCSKNYNSDNASERSKYARTLVGRECLLWNDFFANHYEPVCTKEKNDG